MTVYDSQINVSKQLYQAMIEGCHIVNFIAPPQWGKTGVLVHLVQTIMEKQPSLDQPPSSKHKPLGIEKEKIYVITGLADNDWKKQTRKRFPPNIHRHILHNGDIRSMRRKNELDIKPNSIWIIDESHIGNQCNMTLDSLFHDIISGNRFILDNIYIVCVSATPCNILYDIPTPNPKNKSETKINTRTIIAPPNPKYRDFKAFQFNILNLNASITNARENPDKINDVFDDIMYSVEHHFSTPKFHIVRLRKTNGYNPVFENKLVKYCKDNDYDLHYNTQENGNEYINFLLKIPPKKHSFIICRNRWSASKTLPIKNIGVLVETSKDANSIIQGLPGRLCGYSSFGDEFPLVYCDRKIIEEYMNLVKNGFAYEDIGNWKSSILSKNQHRMICKHSFLAKDSERAKQLKWIFY